MRKLLYSRVDLLLPLLIYVETNVFWMIQCIWMKRMYLPNQEVNERKYETMRESEYLALKGDYSA